MYSSVEMFLLFYHIKINSHVVDLTLPVHLWVRGLRLLKEAEKLRAKEISEIVGCSSAAALHSCAQGHWHWGHNGDTQGWCGTSLGPSPGKLLSITDPYTPEWCCWSLWIFLQVCAELLKVCTELTLSPHVCEIFPCANGKADDQERQEKECWSSCSQRITFLCLPSCRTGSAAFL